jgi:hypothetical protein
MSMQSWKPAFLVAALAAAAISSPGMAGDGWSTENFRFASKAEGAAILTTRDEYIERLSPFDRSARLKTDKEVSESEFLAFAGKQTLDWGEGEKARILEAVRSILPALQEYNVPVMNVAFVRTNGKEEGGAAYTRDSAIFFSPRWMGFDKVKLRRIVAHELFHVTSRMHPDLRAKLYAAIGYARGEEVRLPADLDRIRITNPDGPRNDQYIRVEVDGDAVCATPVLLANRDSYDTSKGGELYHYFQLRYLLTWQGAGNDDYKDPDDPEFAGQGELGGFLEQIGLNTKYTLHPDEILADNFALLITGEGEVKSPDILKKMADIFAAKDGGAAPPTAAEICR